MVSKMSLHKLQQNLCEYAAAPAVQLSPVSGSLPCNISWASLQSQIRLVLHKRTVPLIRVSFLERLPSGLSE